MELTVQEKIQLAVQPLIDRIALLEADNQKFKQEIAQIQSSIQPKAVHKPNVKPGQDATTRPESGKGAHKVLPQTEAGKKKPIGKEETKEEHEQNKIDDGKHPISTPTASVTGQNPSGLHKEPVTHQDNKNPKQLKHARPNVALTGGKSKPADLNNPNAAQQKNGQKQKDEKKEINGGEGENKIISNNNIKKPPPPEKKQIGNINTPKAGAAGGKKVEKGLVADLKKKSTTELKAETSKKQEEGHQEIKTETKQTVVEQKKQQIVQKDETGDLKEKSEDTLIVEAAKTVEAHQQAQSESV